MTRELTAAGVRGILSWGIARELAPGFKTEKLVRPEVVLGTTAR